MCWPGVQAPCGVLPVTCLLAVPIAAKTEFSPWSRDHSRSPESGSRKHVPSGAFRASPCIQKPVGPDNPLTATQDGLGADSRGDVLSVRCLWVGDQHPPASLLDPKGSPWRAEVQGCVAAVGRFPRAHRHLAPQGPCTSAPRMPSPASVCSSSSPSSRACGRTSRGRWSRRSSLETTSSSSTQPTW